MMHEAIIYSLILIAAGTYAVFNVLRMMKSEDFLVKYVKESHKTYLWKKWLGEEKTIVLTRKFFAPLGLIVGTIFILLGLFYLFVILTA